MAKQRSIDLWILETDTVYRAVPFTVATDWIQEGRLLPEDKVRSAGTDKWLVLGKVTAFRAYFPQPEPQRVEDVAEALAPIEADFPWRRSTVDEDDEVDMIPLIDISLVLLIFFMMTAAVSTGMFTPMDTPTAQYQVLTISDNMYWVGIDKKNALGVVRSDGSGRPLPWYSVGKDKETFALPKVGTRGGVATLEPVLERLESEFAKLRGTVRVRLRADKDLPNEIIDRTIVSLQDLRNRINKNRGKGAKIALSISGEVSAPER